MLTVLDNHGRWHYDNQRMSTYDIHAVDVVYVSMFPATMMDAVFVHRDFRSVEHRRFIHVIPSVHITS